MLLSLAGVAIGLEASTFDVGFLTDPVGPKAFPYLVAAVLVMAGVHGALRPRDGGETRGSPQRGTVVRAGAAAGTFLIYAAALPVVGFFASTTLVVAVLSRLFGARWRQALTAAAALSAVLWLLFNQGLGLALPIGDLWIR